MPNKTILLSIILMLSSWNSNSENLYQKHDNRNTFLEIPLNIGAGSAGMYTHLSFVPIFRYFPIAPFAFVQLAAGNGLATESGRGVRYTHSADIYVEASVGNFNSDTEPFDSNGEEWQGSKYRASFHKFFPGSNRWAWHTNFALSRLTQTGRDYNRQQADLKRKK